MACWSVGRLDWWLRVLLDALVLIFKKLPLQFPRRKSIRTAIALAVNLGLQVSQLDVTTAFLNGEVDAEIYMEIPVRLDETLTSLVAHPEDIDEQTLHLVKKQLVNLKRSGVKVKPLTVYTKLNSNCSKSWIRNCRTLV